VRQNKTFFVLGIWFLILGEVSLGVGTGRAGASLLPSLNLMTLSLRKGELKSCLVVWEAVPTQTVNPPQPPTRLQPSVPEAGGRGPQGPSIYRLPAKGLGSWRAGSATCAPGGWGRAECAERLGGRQGTRSGDLPQQGSRRPSARALLCLPAL
jgi:hypothetical protein